jgi:tetratricopeptide (TPR) repeat protein
LKKIETFQKSYSHEHAIEWYTDECFLYKLLNRASRTENIELLYSFRYFIIDLCAALERESKKLSTAGILTLYRGQQIPNEEFEKIRNNVGTLISTNGFLSTSRDISIALNFAHQFRINSDMQTCILEIHADPTLDTVVFADIQQFSKIKKEQKVLFGLNATFKIVRVEMDPVLKMWRIILSTTADGSTRIEEYKRMLEDRMKEHSPVIYFGRLLLYDLGRVDQAEKYFAELLDTLPPDHPDISSVYNSIGDVCRAQGDLNMALKNYEEAYKIRQKVLSSDHPLIAALLNNIGIIHGEKEEFDHVIDSYYQALKIDEKNYPGDHLDKSRTIVNIGLAWKSKGHLETALIWVNQALDMSIRLLPAQHPDIASCLGFIG